MGSIQSIITRFLLRRSNIWNKPLNEVRKTMEGIKETNSVPKWIGTAKEKINGVDFETFIHYEKKSDKVILYFHGGGFCLGIYNANREFVAMLAETSGMDVYMPDYRLAPEHPFPAALEDAIAAYEGLLQNKGYSEKNIIIMGDSSGCALAISALLVLKQSGAKMPCRMAFITPVFDLGGRGDSFVSKAAKDPFKLKDPLGIAKIYIGGNNATTPVISPLYGELCGLPPMLIHGAEYDVFLSDSERMAEKAKEAGVKVDIRLWKKMWHIFHMQAPFVPESSQALNEMCLFVKDV